jgi:hypothetical protein
MLCIVVVGHRYTEAAEECTQGAQLGDYSVGDVLRRTFDEVSSQSDKCCW